MTPTERNELAHALNCIDPDLPRDEWISVLMGLHFEGEEALAREWSEKGCKWDEHAFDSAWHSFKPQGNGHARVTVGSVFHVAKRYGYSPHAGLMAQNAPNQRNITPASPSVIAKPPVECAGSEPDTPFSRFMRGTDAAAHPYVLRKRLDATKLRIVQTWDGHLELGALYCSVSTGKPATVQVIDASGKRKRNWRSYALGDAAWCVRGTGLLAGHETVFVAEGIATAWACLEAVGAGTYEAFACAGKGNLRAVAQALRCRYPLLSIVVVADRDAVDAATRAARACGGLVAAIPDDLVPGNPKADAWDVWSLHGSESLAAVLDAATEPETQAPATVQSGGKPVGIAAVLDAMRADEVLSGLFGFDRMHGCVTFLREKPWPSSHPGWVDNDATNIEARLNSLYRICASVDTITRACHLLAEENAFHPVCQYLDSLQWDGVPRVDGWLITHCGAEDSPYAREVGRVLLLSMVARVRVPGCKADTMPILEGRQGVGKSATLAALGGEFYSDSAPNLETMRETGEILNGIWLLENSEITALRRHEVEAQKAFLSRRVDRYRPAFGRAVVNQPRQCVIVGTTNLIDDYLLDGSGHRRFLPVRVEVCDVQAVIRDRDQLFAEASQRVASGELWWTEDKRLLAAAAGEAEKRQAENPWLNRVRSYVQDRGNPHELLVTSIFKAVTGHEYTIRNSADGRLIAAALREMGYERRKREGANFYVKDGALPAECAPPCAPPRTLAR